MSLWYLNLNCPSFCLFPCVCLWFTRMSKYRSWKVNSLQTTFDNASEQNVKDITRYRILIKQENFKRAASD